MSDILFFIKTLVLTIALIVVMQIHVGDRTIENHALSFVQTSPVVAPLNSVAKGAARLIRDATDSVSKKMKRFTF